MSIWPNGFYHGPRRYDGRDQQMAIHHLNLNLNNLDNLNHQPSNGPIRAKHITQCSSVIGQYD